MTWEDREEEFLKNNCGRLTDEQISIALSKITGKVFTLSMVRGKRSRIKIKKAQGPGVCKVVSREANNDGVV